MKTFVLATALLLAAAPALAGEPVSAPMPETIYNPNVAVPSYDDVQSLRILEPDYGLKEELHLDEPWNRIFESGWLMQEQ
jgi:hypothetical protein